MFEKRQYQYDAVLSINKFFINGRGNPVVVAPTGAGKSFIMAIYIADSVNTFPKTRILSLCNSKQLIKQNYKAIYDLNHNLNIGVYSAALGIKEHNKQITVGSISSMHRKPELFGYIDFVIIDECHQVNHREQGMYRKFIKALKEYNPNIKVIGFTATPYRTGHGYVSHGKESIFDDICYNIEIEYLLENNYLIPPIAKDTGIHADMHNVHIQRGDYVKSEAEEQINKIMVDAIDDLIERSQNRKSIIIFATSVKQCSDIKDLLISKGETAEIITGKTKEDERDLILERVRTFKTRFVINVDVLTTGVDIENIDCVVLLRATQSAILYVQMIGRGLRKYKDLVNCLVLDYGGNVVRHGPVNAVEVENKGGKKNNKNEVKAKVCPACELLIALNARVCMYCGYELIEYHPEEIANINRQASEQAIIDMKLHEPRWVKVLNQYSSLHMPKDKSKQASMKMSYVTFTQTFNEYICFDHSGWARTKAKEWANKRGYNPINLDEALTIDWTKTNEILVKKNGKYWEVLDYKLELLENQ